MHQTTVRFSAEVWADLSEEADALGVSVAQFVRDLLYAMLGMRGPARDPWAFAVLIELGEHRRVGNAYTPEDVRKTVFALRARIAAYAAKAGR